VLGLSPAVITETLWALAERRDDSGRPAPFFVDEVHILTTARGVEQVRTRLEGANGGLARFHQLCAQAPRPQVFVEPIRNAAGEVLADIRTEADNAALGDATVRLIGRLTERDDLRLHASMAGGRKTMSFFMGYVMSLFGRPGDELSHVLLLDERFEFCRDFWCPARTSMPLRYTDRGSGEEVALDAAEARIDLTPIPFVPLRYLLPAGDLASLRHGTYAGVVRAVRDIIENPKVTLDDARRQIASGQLRFRLPHQSYAMYRLLMDVRRQQRPGAGPEGVGPKHSGWLTVKDFVAPDSEMVQTFAALYEEVRDPGSGLKEEFLSGLVDAQGKALDVQQRFSVIRSRLDGHLRERIRNTAVLDRLRVYDVEGSGIVGGGQPNRFGLMLKPAQIEIIER
jgi:CRISPR-associated protein (TIGR02584 family)